jgi:transcriptional regulator with GAF, ATPase, and Fis domain
VGASSWSHPGDDTDGKGDAPAQVSDTVLRRVREAGEALLVSDMTVEAELRSARSVRSLGIRSAIGTPVYVGEQPVGYLYIDRRGGSGEPYQEPDLLLLVCVGRLISSAVVNSTRFARLVAENRALRSSQMQGGLIVGTSPELHELREIIEEKVGPVKSTVLLVGETGTGKSLVAEAIHLASPRRDAPLVKVNCAAIPRELIESELFGHEKGAFSGADRQKTGQFEAASGGTLFLDEVGELERSAQAKLLSALQDRQIRRVGGDEPVDIDVRVVAATNRDLEREVEAGAFRDDLYYRLNVVRLTIPPLRDRREDILPLARHFLEIACREVGRRSTGLSSNVEALIESHDWPGNVRELANCIERAVIFAADDGPLEPQHLPAELLRDLPPEDAGRAAGGELDPVARKERQMIVQALERAGGNKREAARQLGWYPQKLYNRIRRYKLDED